MRGVITRPETIDEWLKLIRAEYDEMPGLNLTKAQIQRLWGLDPSLCDRLLVALERTRFLKRTASNGYVRGDRER